MNKSRIIENSGKAGKYSAAIIKMAGLGVVDITSASAKFILKKIKK